MPVLERIKRLIGTRGDDDRFGVHGAWAMAVGGMIGGGIFSVLGIVVALAGRLAWLSFVIAGVVALMTGISYIRLTLAAKHSGGIYVFLRGMKSPNFAAIVAWVLIAAYTLTISVYAYTFGHYLAQALPLSEWLARALSGVVVAALVAINLAGVSHATWSEILMVWAKLLILGAVAGTGLLLASPDALAGGAPSERGWPAGLAQAFVGAATVFMAYEGFQLLAYDWTAMRDPERTFTRAIVLGIVTVIGVYVVVSIGALALVSEAEMIREQEVALALAGERAFGFAGVVMVAIGAAVSAGSAINATLFATARLGSDLAQNDDLPRFLQHRNAAGAPDHGVLLLGGVGGLLGVVGSLGALVEAASLAFLLVFAVVNGIAAARFRDRRWVPVAGFAGAFGGAVMLVIDLADRQPALLSVLGLAVAVAGAIRLYQIYRRRGRGPVDRFLD